MKKKKQAEAKQDQQNQLQLLLKKEPELASKLTEALETGRFLITLTFQKKYTNQDEHDLQHYWIRKNFMNQDVVPSLQHIISDFNAKENPTAELPNKKNLY